ncbi:MAG: hypothetical protein IPL79_03640 [Myxococcales bacterium]|nr:hypothetical protein [Myxococcales bacterium]
MSNNATGAWLLQVGNSMREEFADTRRVLTFAAYLDLASSQPTRHIRDAARYVLDCLDYFGTYEVTTPRGSETRYKLFDAPWDATGEERLVGQEGVAAAVYRLIASSVRQGNVNNVILLHGPNGSAKSTLIRTIGRAMEHYATLPDGAMYRFSWVFPKTKLGKSSIGFGGAAELESLESFALASDDEVDARVGDELRDHPLLLLPTAQRRTFMAEALERVGLTGTHLVPDTLEHGALSPKNRAIFDALLASYGGDYLRVLRHVRVERFYIDERFRQGYVTVEPQMSVDASERQVTADRSLRRAAGEPANLGAV